ncbi:MAG: hypothetical protein ACKOAD_08550 [Gammaproteobacteria bacterium]
MSKKLEFLQTIHSLFFDFITQDLILDPVFYADNPDPKKARFFSASNLEQSFKSINEDFRTLENIEEDLMRGLPLYPFLMTTEDLDERFARRQEIGIRLGQHHAPDDPRHLNPNEIKDPLNSSQKLKKSEMVLEKADDLMALLYAVAMNMLAINPVDFIKDGELYSGLEDILTFLEANPKVLERGRILLAMLDAGSKCEGFGTALYHLDSEISLKQQHLIENLGLEAFIPEIAWASDLELKGIRRTIDKFQKSGRFEEIDVEYRNSKLQAEYKSRTLKLLWEYGQETKKRSDSAQKIREHLEAILENLGETGLDQRDLFDKNLVFLKKELDVCPIPKLRRDYIEILDLLERIVDVHKQIMRGQKILGLKNQLESKINNLSLENNRPLEQNLKTRLTGKINKIYNAYPGKAHAFK